MADNFSNITIVEFTKGIKCNLNQALPFQADSVLGMPTAVHCAVLPHLNQEVPFAMNLFEWFDRTGYFDISRCDLMFTESVSFSNGVR